MQIDNFLLLLQSKTNKQLENMRFLTHFHDSKQPLIIETKSFHVLDARDEITKIIGKRPTSMSRIDDDEVILIDLEDN